MREQVAEILYRVCASERDAFIKEYGLPQRPSRSWNDLTESSKGYWMKQAEAFVTPISAGERVLCDDTGCLYCHVFEDGPKHLQGSHTPQDWDKGYRGYCMRSEIAVKVKTIDVLNSRGDSIHHVIPECRCRTTAREWRIRLPDPDKIQTGRILGSQEH